MMDIPTPGSLWWITMGRTGRAIAHVVATTAQRAQVRPWSSGAQHWRPAQWVQRSRFLQPATAQDCTLWGVRDDTPAEHRAEAIASARRLHRALLLPSPISASACARPSNSGGSSPSTRKDSMTSPTADRLRRLGLGLALVLLLLLLWGLVHGAMRGCRRDAATQARCTAVFG